MNNIEEKNFVKADELYFAFMNYLDDSTVSEFIETDPNNQKGTRYTEKGKDLFYVQHGIDENIYKPVDGTDKTFNEFKKNLLQGFDAEFVVYYNNSI